MRAISATSKVWTWSPKSTRTWRAVPPKKGAVHHLPVLERDGVAKTGRCYSQCDANLQKAHKIPLFGPPQLIACRV
jgi:hypothetical protein